MSPTMQVIIIVVVLVVIVTIFVTIKSKRDEKLGVDSPAKHMVEELVRKAVPEGESVTALYARREETEYYGKRTTTKYWYFGIGINLDRIYVVPLSFDGDNIIGGQPGVIEKKRLYRIDGSAKGSVFSKVFFYENQGDKKPFMNLVVQASNTKEDRFHPVNIQQEEEANRYCTMMQQWFEDVNTAHGIKPNGRPLKK